MFFEGGGWREEAGNFFGILGWGNLVSWSLFCKGVNLLFCRKQALDTNVASFFE